MKTLEFTGIIGIDILPQNIADALKEAEGDDITVKFVSVGGYVFEGFQIYNQIREYSGNKTIILNGVVASIAAYISTAFNKAIVKNNSTFMIHNAMGGAIGDYRVLEKEANELKRLNDVIGKNYAARSGQPIDTILDLMNEETWYYGEEIIEAGFADEMADSPQKAESESDKTQILKTAKAKYNSLKLDPKADDILKAAAMLDKQSTDVVDRNKLTGRNNSMPKKNEVIETLKVLKQNAEITLPELAEALGLKDQIISQNHIDALNIVNELMKMNIKDPVNEIKTLRKQISDDKDAVRNAYLDKTLGTHTDESRNELRYYVGKQTENIFGEDLEKKINEMKESDPIMQRLMAARADSDSDENIIGVSDEQRKNKIKNNETVAVKRNRVDVL
jgi:ATP-dependent protease ClpP protease subunit